MMKEYKPTYLPIYANPSDLAREALIAKPILSGKERRKLRRKAERNQNKKS